MLNGGLRPEEAAQACGVSVRTAYKWLRRFRDEGVRAQRPFLSSQNCPHALSDDVRQKRFAQRRSRRTYRQISQECGVAPSTLGRWLAREGLNRLAALEPAPPIVRYEHPNPGDMLHLDIKKWVVSTSQATGSRITANRTPVTRAGSTMHVAQDDHSRVSGLPASSLTKPLERLSGFGGGVALLPHAWRHLQARADG